MLHWSIGIFCTFAALGRWFSGRWGLAGALAQAVDVQDDHGAGFQAEPSALDELGQGLVNDFA